MITRATFSISLHTIRRKITHTSLHKLSTNKLPKPSRFSQQLGLQKQFQKVQSQSVQKQKQTMSAYNLAIGAAICLIGSIIMTGLIKQEVRDKLRIRLIMMRIAVAPVYDKFQMYLGLLSKVAQFQQQFYKNRMYQDRSTLSVITSCVQLELPINNKQQIKAYFQLMDRCLYHNLQNQRNSRQKYQIYQKYLQKLAIVGQGIYKQQANMQKIISKLVKQADLQLLYLMSYLVSLNMLTLSTSDKQMYRTRLPKLKEEIASNQQNLDTILQKNAHLLLQPYKFKARIERKWIKYIESVI